MTVRRPCAMPKEHVFLNGRVSCAGASYGQWRIPWSPEEREDSVEIIEWITRQKWSNGQVRPSLRYIVVFPHLAMCRERKTTAK